MPRNRYTETIAATLCDRVAHGQVLSAAARACGLTPSTVHDRLGETTNAGHPSAVRK